MMEENCRSSRRMIAVLVLSLALFAASCSSSGENDLSDGTSTVPPTVNTSSPPDDSPIQGVLGASPGVLEDRVVFGQSAAFSGPAKDLGNGMRLGIEAAFEEVNQSGGVHGRRLELVSFDDAYEPEAAIDNTLQLINSGGVFALIGAVGTPTSRSAVPVATAGEIPYLAPFTGAAFLRDPQQTIVFNLRASYNQETEEMVDRLVTELGIERIAVMYQDDSFGQAGYNGARAALDRRGMEAVSVGLYQRNTTAVKTGLLDLKQGDPQGVIVIGAYQPVAWLIRWARETGMDAVFVAISFVGSNALAQELGPDGAGVLTTQVVPFPTDASVSVVSSYLDALAAYHSQAVPGFVSLEGYLAGRLAIAGLESCGRTVDRECFSDRFASSEPIDIDGFVMNFGEDDNQGSDQVFWTMIDENGDYRPLSDWQVMAP
ncbi:MAG: ABC transporter substrate-binding protein [Acidimicrobiaceae bacterium]|nr:ABC transporter substrate-binding protein [Acidimicrobiaceae bacterium]MYD08017.1 ABC transporter substrate-binding protein [Acidimicrobiaceae bacterium]MYG56284.1 ABC transporter substrate-binding protein [Acidimicrobiaceae bacterium]MYJ97768.1 ABC transporter substrate-binding protein [Acidimicrobiaceae bacterium]